MSQTALSEIIRLLPSLSQDELQSLKGRLQFLSLSTGGTASDGDSGVLLDVIVQVMQAHGGDVSNSAMLQRASVFSAMKQKVPALFTYLRGAKLSRVQMRALLVIAVDLLYRDMQTMWPAAVLSSRTIMSHVHRIPATLQRHFPCYAECGLLPMIVRGAKQQGDMNVRDERNSRSAVL